MEVVMSNREFLETISFISERIGERSLDSQLAEYLSAEFPVDGDAFSKLKALCVQGEAEGWLMAREAGGIKFGRAVKPGQ